MKIREEFTCPLEIAHDVIRGKWKPLIVWNLRETQSLSSLQRSIHGVTQKMLLEQLKELIEFQLVDKKNYDGYPLKVDYFLTERGRELLQAIVILQKIGSDIQQEKVNSIQNNHTHEKVGN